MSKIKVKLIAWAILPIFILIIIYDISDEVVTNVATTSIEPSSKQLYSPSLDQVDPFKEFIEKQSSLQNSAEAPTVPQVENVVRSQDPFKDFLDAKLMSSGASIASPFEK